jgi:hypothetical protein
VPQTTGYAPPISRLIRSGAHYCERHTPLRSEVPDTVWCMVQRKRKAGRCPSCGGLARMDARAIYCSKACRQAAYRLRKRQLSNADGVYYVRSRVMSPQVETLGGQLRRTTPVSYDETRRGSSEIPGTNVPAEFLPAGVGDSVREENKLLLR